MGFGVAAHSCLYTFEVVFVLLYFKHYCIVIVICHDGEADDRFLDG